MDAVALACCSAVLFGTMTPAIRFALRETGDVELGALVTASVAFAVCLAAAVVAAAFHGVGDVAAAWPFAATGVVAPGASQILFVRAISEAGPSRASVTVGTAPLISVAIALALLDEPLRAGLVVGAALIVLGGVALVGERVRPDHFRLVGLGLGFGAAVLFASRDNFVRWFSGESNVPPFVAAAATSGAGALFLLAYLLWTRRRLPTASARAFVPGGLLFGLSYVALFDAYYRGRVTVVSPLVATESLWGVLTSAILFGRTELIGRRLVAGALLIVAGGALIGAVR